MLKSLELRVYHDMNIISRRFLYEGPWMEQATQFKYWEKYNKDLTHLRSSIPDTCITCPNNACETRTTYSTHI